MVDSDEKPRRRLGTSEQHPHRLGIGCETRKGWVVTDLQMSLLTLLHCAFGLLRRGERCRSSAASCAANTLVCCRMLGRHHGFVFLRDRTSSTSFPDFPPLPPNILDGPFHARHGTWFLRPAVDVTCRRKDSHPSAPRIRHSTRIVGQ